MPSALSGLKVIELAQGVAGPYCGKLLAGFGADVLKLEPPEGDSSRRLGPFVKDVLDSEASGHYLYLNTGKRSAVLDIGVEPGAQLLKAWSARADVLIEDLRPGALDSLGVGYSDLARANPGLIFASITAFGQDGPYSGFKATNLVVHALSGEAHLAGVAELPPLKKGGYLADYHAGLQGFIGVLAALHARHRDGRGQHVDVSHLECLTSVIGASINSWLYDGSVSSRRSADPWSQGTAAQRGADGSRWGPSGVWKASDGFVLAYGRASADWTGAFAEMAEAVPQLGDTRYASVEGRDENVGELLALFEAWVSQHTKEEVYRLAQRHGHPFGYVATAPDLLDSAQLRARRFFVEVDHPVAGKLPYPGAPFIMSSTPFQNRRAPLLGEHSGAQSVANWESQGGPPPKAAGPVDAAPLDGIRVLDFTHVWAGPFCTRILGDLGAEVIKVEHAARGDGGRGARIGRFHAYSRNKMGITLDLRTAEGPPLIQQLVAISDVVIENFSVGVMKRLGVDYEDCRTMRPDVVYVALPAFGREGPEADFVGMGATQEAMSGLLSVTGHPGTLPNPTGVKYGDPNGGVFAAAAAITAIWHRRVTGEGQLVDLSQREANIAVLPQLVFEYAMNGRVAKSLGNRHPEFAPHGCYRSAGDDQWVAISVTTESEFEALCNAIEARHLLGDERFGDARSRKRHEDELDRVVESWTQVRGSREAMHLLQREGVPAGAVLNNQQVVEDPHFAARGFFEKVDHAEAGVHTHLGMPWKLARTPGRVRTFAPNLGQHNAYVLRELLGVSESEFSLLEARDVIASGPIGR